MTTPFTTYVSIKDNYCIAYFGDNKEMINKILEARQFINQSLEGIKVFILVKDIFKEILKNQSNIIWESQIGDYKGKIAFFSNLEKKEDLKSLLIESKISIPEDF